MEPNYLTGDYTEKELDDAKTKEEKTPCACGRIGTVFSTRVRAPNGYRKAYIRTYDIDQASLVQLKEELSENVKILYIINERERISEIF